ncbi:MAG: HlyD family type I secretion periplasmic adaptor subunit [Rhodospirillales bacterium]
MTQTNTPSSYTAETQAPARSEPSLTVLEDGTGSAAEGRRRLWSRGVMAAVAVLVAAVGSWISFAEIQETVEAKGAVVPAGQVRAVQHLEGGIVLEVLAKEGQLIEEGAVLLRLDPAQIKARYEQARIEETALKLKAERLRAIGDGREPNFGFADPAFQELVQDQWAIYNGFQRAQENRRIILEQRIQQRQADLDRLKGEDETLTRKAQILAEELAMREELFRKGLSPKILLLNVRRQVADVRGDLASIISKREKLTKAVEEANTELDVLESQSREEALADLGLVTARLAQASEEVKQLTTRVAAFDIRAPVRGFVKGIAAYAKDRIVPAGATVMEVVPVDDELIAEVHLAPRDIGRITVGQPVAVQITGAGGGQTGRVNGELRDVSAGTFKDDAGQPYYRATVVLDQAFTGEDPNANKILPGMEVKTRIRTGKRTVLEYLFSPAKAPRRLL